MGTLSPTHKPDYTMTEPPVEIPYQQTWSDPKKIVSLDPYGHVVSVAYARQLQEQGLDVRPSIAVTKAHIKLSEIDESSRKGEIIIDGKNRFEEHTIEK